jgi:hypothetical protein
MRASYLTAVAALGMTVSVAGCTQDTAAAPAPAPAAVAAPAPTVASQIDPRWMGLGTSQLWNWELRERTITPDFQQFGLRPLNSDEGPLRGGCGCGSDPLEANTAVLTAFTTGKFDPTEARGDQPVTVNGREGFFRPSVDLEDAVLTWSYADDAWATVHGRASDTSELDVMVALAGDLRPTDRTPVRLPLRLSDVPSEMPLSSIKVQSGRRPTIVHFDTCQPYAYGLPFPECTSTADSMSITIRPDSHDLETYEDEGTPSLYDDAVAVTIDGRNGLWDKESNQAGAQLRPGMEVEFSLAPHGGFRVPAPTRITTKLKQVFDGVVWAQDPGDEATWPEVTTWAK